MKYKLNVALAALLLLTGCAHPADKESFASLMTKDGEPEITAEASVTTQNTASEEITATQETTTAETTTQESVTTTEETTTEATTTSATGEETASPLEPDSEVEAEDDETVIENEPENEVPFVNGDKYFFLVNREYPLPDDYEIETDYVQGSYELEVTAAKYCRDMIEAAREDGIELKVLSAYRTVSYQKKLFERNIKSRMEKYGWDYDTAYADVLINIALPGTSEHNAGLAVDIVTEDDWDTYEAFDQTKEYDWLQEHAAEFGFILRYLKDKTDVTGYIYEPWHYRYIGVEYAADVRDSGLCLEEYFEQYVWVEDTQSEEETVDTE